MSLKKFVEASERFLDEGASNAIYLAKVNSGGGGQVEMYFAKKEDAVQELKDGFGGDLFEIRPYTSRKDPLKNTHDQVRFIRI